MEAVPRMPMLSFELKQCPEYVDFGPVLKQYIKTHYGEDPAHYNKACSDLEQLRQSAIHVSHDFMGCSTLKKYFAQLQFLQGRFPMGEDGECGINFTWEDVFLGREVTIPDVKFEQACILYNIGALHSILGTIETRQNADGMKVSCTHFQCAAWAFEYLRDHFGSSNLSVDMSHEVLTFQVSLMLAQAQECILEKSMIDSRKNTITAKVAAQVTEFYRAVIRGLQAENMDAILGSRQFKEWKKRAEMKILFYEVITNYYMGKNSEEQEKFGECVAYYTLAFDKLKDCAKMAKNESSDIQESLRFMNDVVGGKYQSAKKDNDFVYHDKIPAADTLPEVKGASLVKGIPFNWNDSEVSGPDIFQKLVPMSAHEASSMYSEEKAKLLRQVGGEIEDKNVALLQFMSSLNLDPGKLNFEPERLPQDLLEKCAAVSVRPNAIKDLTDAMGAVSNSATEVQMAIDEINALIENDAKEDEEFQKQFGKRTSNPMLPEIKKECDRFEEGHKKGNQSNVDLHKAMNTHIINLRLLAGPLEDIKNHLPSLERDKDPETEAIIRDLQKLLNKVEEMKGQRSMLEEQFRSQVKDDDITNRIVSQDGSTNPSVMFGEQIKKHDKQIELIRQNLNAQDNILRALTEANARYANTRRTTAETQARREATIEELKNSYDVYEDLLAKSQKGLEFYKKLESNINRLLERCRGICKQQAEERKQIQDRLKPKEPQPRPAPSSKPSAQQGMSMADPGFSPLQGPSMPYASPSGVMGPLPDIHSSLPGFEGPKLKDYLPFMKPKTFGKKGTGSLPSSGVSSPVHLPQGPDSVPGSPLHGMSDEDLRRLGISDPKVLAMIKAHSVPSSGASGMGPGPGGPPRQPDPMMNTQPMRHPSPSQSPNMMGVQNVPGRVPSTGVRFDRSTKPNYPQNAGPQSALQMPQRPMQPGMPQQNFGPNQQYGPQPQMPTSSQQAFYNTNVSPQIYGLAGGNVPQVQANIGPNQPVGPQGQQTMIQPSSQPQYSGMNTGVSYPSPAQSPQIPTDQRSDPRLNVTNTSQPYQAFPRQSTSQMDNVGPGQSIMPGRSSSSDTNVQAFSQGAQFVPIGHPAQAGISPPLYGDTQRDRMNQMQPQPPQSIPNQPTSYISGQDNYQQPQSLSSQGQNYQQPQTNKVYSQQPPVNMSSGYQQQMGQGQTSRDQGHGQYPDARGTPSSTGNSMSSVSSASQQVPSSGMYGYSHMGQGQPDQRSLPSGQPGALQQPGYPPNQQPPQGQGPTSQGFGQNMNYGQGQNFPQQRVPSNVGQGQPQQGQGQIRQHQLQQPQGPNTNQQYTGPRQSQNQVEQPVIQGQSQHAYGPQGQMSQANTHPQQQPFTSQGQLSPQGSYSLPPSQSPSNQAQINQPQVQTGQQGQMLQQQQPQMQSGYVSKPPVQNISDGKSQGPSAVQQGGQFSQYGQNVSAVQSGQSGPQQVTGPIPAYSQPQSVQHGYQVRPSGTNQNQPNAGQYQTGPQGPSPVNQAQQYYPGQQQGGGTLTQQPVQGPGQPGGNLMQQPLQGPQQGSGTLGQQPLQGPQQPLASQQQNVRPLMPTSSGQFGSLNPQNQQQQVYRPQIPQSSVHQGPGQGYSGPSSSQGPGQGYSGPPSSHSGNVGHSQQLQGQNINFPPQQTGQHSNLSSQQTGQQGFNTGLQTSASFPQSQGYYQHQPSGSTLGPQPGGSLQQPSGGTLGHQSGGSLQPQPKIDENMAPLPHYSQAGSSAGQSVTSQVQPTMSIGHMTTMTAPYPGSQARQGPAPGWQRNPTVPQMGTGTPQPMPSVQQLNPLSPPDVLPQPILPSPIKPEVHTSLQDVTMETPIPKQEVPPRAQDSPVSHRRQEKTHSRSNSNTSQSDYKVLRKNSSSSIGSSLDDILSSSPLDSTHEPPKPVLTPKVLTAQEIAQQKEEAMMKKGTLGRQVSKDPYPDSTKMDKFVAETEKLAKFVESLSKATCSGPSHLDIAWKEIIEDHDIHGKKHSMAIGRCYPMKNRDQDVLPYDETRVLLTSHKDDYINASWINDLAESCPKFIATQAPLHSSLFDFWLMVYEQGSEVIVMLSSDVESKDTKKFPEYWPSEKGRPMHHGPITLTLQSFKDRQIWTERIIYLQHQETKQGRTIVQLQFMNWPVSGFPEKVPSLLMFIHEVHTFYRQQRSLLKPVMVHCSNGIGRTGAFLMVYTGMQEIDHGNGIINVQSVARKMLQQRQSIIREKSQLKFCYEAILYHAQDILGKQGILVHKASFGGKLPQPGEKSYQWTPTDDVIFGSTCSISDLKSNVEKMGFHLGLSGQQSSPKKQSTAKQEVTDKEVENDQRPSSPPNKEELTNEGTLISALPDVVQRTESSRKHVEGDQILSGSLSGSNASLLSIGSEPDKATGTPVHKIRSRGTSPKPGSFPGSHEGSPKLQSLLDPSTFSIGSDSGKRKITKASFVEKTSSLSDNVDMSDPLSSLDPLWSMKK